MRFLFALTTILLFSCNQQKGNSHSSDEAINDNISVLKENSNSVDENGNFNSALVLSILETKCISCHRHDSWPKTDADWLNNGGINFDIPENSTIYQRMKNCGSGVDANMPPSNGDDPIPMTDEQCDLIIEWIDYLKELKSE